MARPLTPKAKKPVVQIWEDLLRKGYEPLPSIGKQPAIKGWPKAPVDVVAQASWPKSVGAGIRMADDLLVLDFDIKDAAVLQAVLDRVFARWPQLRGAVQRHSGAVSLMLFARCKVTSTKYSCTHGYGVDAAGPKTAMVEIFTGLAVRHVAVYGPHPKSTPDAPRAYGYNGAELWKVERTHLPAIGEDDIVKIIDECDDVLADMLTGLESPGMTHHGHEQVFDLVPGMIFREEDGREIELEELEGELRRGEERRGYANIWDPGSDTADRCKASLGSGGLVIVDFKGAGTTHRWASAAPPPGLDLSALKAIAAAHPAGSYQPDNSIPDDGGDDGAPPPPPSGGTLDDTRDWLLLTHGYCAPIDMVVRLFEPGTDCLLTPKAFERNYAAWSQPKISPSTGQPLTSLDRATTRWELSPAKPLIRGVRLRPDQPFPLYEEDGEVFKNTYRKPRHVGAGDIAEWLRFIEHLLPEPTQREWFLSWLAHKWQRPGVPGVAVVMVAARDGVPVYGTGRGMLKEVLLRLMGTTYVRSLGYEILSHGDGQGAYTDWAAYATLVVVDESRDTPDAQRRGRKTANYERLKEFVDPRAVKRTFHPKGLPAFEGLCFASYLICSNNIDALQIPENDRRFAVLDNGLQLPAAQARALDAWMNTPGNIAELARWLETRDLSGFNIHEPIVTDAKAAMQALAESEADGWLRDVRAIVPRGSLFTKRQIMLAVQRENGTDIERDANAKWRFDTAFGQASELAKDRDLKISWGGQHARVYCWRGDRKTFAEGLVGSAHAVRSGIELTEKRIQRAIPPTGVGKLPT